MSRRALVVSCAFALLAACQPSSETRAEVKLETEEQKTLYALGLILAGNLSTFGLSADDLSVLQQGIEDGVLQRKPKVDAKAYRSKIQELQKSRRASVSKAEKQASAAFLEQEAAREGAERTASGLIYIPIQQGEGDGPSATDTVRVHYEGTLRDGTVFDSSRARGRPFVTKLNGVIPCWTEGMQKMKPGGKARIVCPSEIAYGERGAPPLIKPGAALAFDVELIEIVK